MVEITDENNNENKSWIDSLDREPGYYSQVVRPMLAPGHETELIYWFKNIGLIPNSQVCDNAKLNEDCNKIMEWIPAKVIDYYQWKCRNCSRKKSIRNNSIFQEVKSNCNNFVRVLLGWCKGHDVHTMANVLGLKKCNMKSLYNILTIAAKKHLKFHGQREQIGGPGVIVIIDTYPEGLNNSVRSNRPILCLVEAKNVPPRYYFEALDRFSRNNPEQIKAIKQDVLKIIQDMVMPGSVLVTRLDSTFCSYYDLQSLGRLFPTIVSAEGLARHDNENQTILSNLETIWNIALEVCEQSQSFSYDQVPYFLTSYMWRSRFGNEAFQMLLNCLTEMQ